MDRLAQISRGWRRMQYIESTEGYIISFIDLCIESLLACFHIVSYVIIWRICYYFKRSDGYVA